MMTSRSTRRFFIRIMEKRPGYIGCNQCSGVLCRLLFICRITVFSIYCLRADSAQEVAHRFKQHSQSNWLDHINKQTEVITQNPEFITRQIPDLTQEKFSDSPYRQKLESYYQNEDFDGLQSFGERRGQQLETEQSPEGEAWRLLNQSPDRYYPDANEDRILGAMALGINALQHPNTWSKQKHWPVDAQGNSVYDSNREISATIARLRQHFKGCDYQKQLVLKQDRQVHSPDIRECIQALVTDSSITLHR